jgi:flavin reductase (DIM6/NTAB) family NADH-FMN oxidoreductase RutF
MVAFSASRRPEGTKKDAHKDAEETGVFAWNVTSEPLAEAMNWSSAPLPATESEFELAGLSHSRARQIDAPTVDAAPIVFECRYVRTVEIPKVKGGSVEGDNFLVVGEVTTYWSIFNRQSAAGDCPAAA